jgi:hypothetical protein
MEWHIVLAALSGVLGVASVVPYVWDILHGETKPNAVTFGLWMVLNVIAAAAQWDAGARWSVIVTAAVAFNCGIVTILVLRGYGVREYGRFDALSLALAVVAIVGWKTGHPMAGIVCPIIADLCAAAPTVKKVYYHPRSENLSGWAMITVSSLLGALSADHLDFASLAMPVYLTVSSGAIFALAYFRRLKSD